jgi:hypothetical protein
LTRQTSIVIAPLEHWYQSFRTNGPLAPKSTEELNKLSMYIKTCFISGHKHTQFIIVNGETLKNIRKQTGQIRKLIVRVAGYSAYFLLLTRALQNNILAGAGLQKAGQNNLDQKELEA